MKLTTRILTLMILVFGVMAAIPQTGAAQSKDERAIRAVGEAWQRYIAEDKVDSIVGIFTPDAIFMLANSPPTRGTVALRAGWDELVKTPGLDLHWTPQRIDVTSPTRAVEYGTYTESYDTPNGKGRDAGTYVTVWHKQRGKWKVAYDAPVSSLPAAPAAAAPPMESSEFVARNASSLAWSDFAPPGFPPGARISVLSGDPSKAGQFVLRLSFPADYLVPLHWHPTSETVTVLSGQVHFGMGNSVDMAKTQAFGPGDLVYIPARHAHFVHAAAPTVVQVTGNGPFQLNLGAPK